MSIPALLLAAALLPVAFVLAELLARAWIRFRGRSFVWSPHRRTLQVLDPESFTGLPELARFEVNRDGERGDEPPAESWEAYRILVLGGSSTECRYIDQKSAWPAVVQQFLNQPESLDLLRARRAHVGNLGRSLTNCRQLKVILERVLPRYDQLDAVVLMIGASDVVQWLASGAGERVDAAAVPDEELFDEQPSGPFGWTPSTLALRRVVARTFRGLFGRIETHRGAGRGVGRARRARAAATKLVDTLPDPAPMLAHFDAHFRDLVRLAQAEARTVIVVRPCWARGGVGRDAPDLGWMFADGDLRGGKVDRWYTQRVADRLLEMVERRISAVARELGVPEIDPKLLVEAGPEHFYDVGHLTPAGCTIVGNSIAQAVLRERRGGFAARLRAVSDDRHADVA